MTRKRRSEMRPGEVFALEHSTDWRGYCVDIRKALVVVDAKSEVDFWTGVKWHVGGIAPGLDYEVLS